jgi:hypothetical protein
VRIEVAVQHVSEESRSGAFIAVSYLEKGACRLGACLVSFCGVILELLLCNGAPRPAASSSAWFCLLARESLRIAARLTDTSYGKMAWQMGFLGKWREKGRAKREVVLSLKLKANDRESWVFEGSGRCG